MEVDVTKTIGLVKVKIASDEKQVNDVTFPCACSTDVSLFLTNSCRSSPCHTVRQNMFLF